MELSISKYVKADQHPLGPFTIRVVYGGGDAIAALEVLRKVLEDVRRDAEAAGRAGAEPKEVRSPRLCANCLDLVETPKKTYYFVLCKAHEDRGLLAPRDLIDGAAELKECVECRLFKPREEDKES
jgi:hypothetical protein